MQCHNQGLTKTTGQSEKKGALYFWRILISSRCAVPHRFLNLLHLCAVDLSPFRLIIFHLLLHSLAPLTTVKIGKPERQERKASHCGSKQQYKSHTANTLLLIVRATYIWVLFFAHILFVVNGTFNATPTERLQLLFYSTPVIQFSLGSLFT